MARKKNEIEEVSTEVGKKSALSVAFTQINKKHSNALKWLADVPCGYDFIPTGSVSLDFALGGGFPRGRMVELLGWESSGKSTIAMSTAAQANKLGIKVLYIDCERAIDKSLVASYGVDPNMFLLDNSPLSMEEHFEIIYGLLGTSEIGMVVVDSVSSLIPQAELDGCAGDSHVGLQARFLSQECRKIVNMIGESNTLFIFINQYREKVMAYGDPKVTSGGHAIPFYCTHRLESQGGKTKESIILDDKGVAIGHRMKYKVLKNKIGMPFRSGSIDLIYGKGFDALSELVDLSTDTGLISLGGAWYTIPETGEKVQGKDKMKLYLEEHTEFRNDLTLRVRSMLGM